MPTFRQDVKVGTKVPLIKKSEISDFVVGEGDIIDGSVTANKIADKTITKEKLTDDVLTSDNIKVGDDNLSNVLGSKFNSSNVVQETGYSEQMVMSQKAVTEELDNIVSVLVKNGFNIDILSTNGWTFRLANIMNLRADGTYAGFTTLNLSAKWYAQNITDKIYNISWSRNSGDKEADEAWNKAHEKSSLVLPLSYEDLGSSAYQIGHVNFTCIAEYDADGEWQKTQKTVSF